MIKNTPPLPDSFSRRDALKALTLGFAGMITTGLAEDKKESALPPLPEIKTKEEALVYLQETLRPAIGQALSDLANKKQWSYTTSEESFRNDFATASKSIPALMQLAELVEKGHITTDIIYRQYPGQSEHGIDIRVNGAEGPNNGFYWSSQSINPEWRGSL